MTPKVLSSSDINALRYSLFCSKKREIESNQLPPCKDCLVKHTQRALFGEDVWSMIHKGNVQMEEDGRLIKEMVQKQIS